MASNPQVLFNKPILFDIQAPRPAGRPTILSYPEISTLIRGLREEGWSERAVVSRRVSFQNGYLNYFEMSRPVNWGIVIDMRTTAVAVVNQPYLPIKVQWVRDGNVTEHWPEDLLLIHPGLDQFKIEKIAKEQFNAL